MGQTATRLLCFSLILATGSVCFAQRNALPTAPPPDKKPCDVLTKSDAESILGQPVDLRDNNPFQCGYVEVGWTNKPPKNKQIRLNVSTNAAPKPTDLADKWKNMADYPMPTRTSKDLPNFADAAIWNWYQGHGGELTAFKGGTIQVNVILSGLPEDVALEHAKSLAAKVLGGSGGTGYAYNTPKIMPRMDKPPVATADALPPEKAAPLAALQGGKTFAEAVPITDGQFLQEVKEVSLTIVSSPTLAKYISEAEVQRYLVNLLTFYHISVKPNAPVALQVTIDELISGFTTTTTSYDRYGALPDTHEDFHAHSVAVSLEFFIRTAIWRNGAFHQLVVAPVSSIYFNNISETRELRKQIVGDDTPGDMRTAITEMLTSAFKDIATGKTIDETPWLVSAWSDKEKGAANAAFTKALSASSVEKRPTEGLDSLPKLELNPQLQDACKGDPSWADFWNAEFQRQGWVKPQEGVTLYHFVLCGWNQLLGFPGYYSLQDTVRLYESNIVFDLHGKFFRKRAELFGTHRMMTTMGDQLAAAQQGFLPRSIMEFSTKLTLGKRTVPVVSPASNTH
jgi:hypothetical protein